MKKLKLKLDGIEPLSKNQMKQINGGYACFFYWCHEDTGVHADYDLHVSCMDTDPSYLQPIIDFWQAAGCNAGILY